MRDDEVRGEEEEENGIHGVHFRGKWSQRKVEVGKGSDLEALVYDGNCLHWEVQRVFSLRCKSL